MHHAGHQVNAILSKNNLRFCQDSDKSPFSHVISISMDKHIPVKKVFTVQGEAKSAPMVSAAER